MSYTHKQNKNKRLKQRKDTKKHGDGKQVYCLGGGGGDCLWACTSVQTHQITDITFVQVLE